MYKCHCYTYIRTNWYICTVHTTVQYVLCTSIYVHQYLHCDLQYSMYSVYTHLYKGQVQMYILWYVHTVCELWSLEGVTNLLYVLNTHWLQAVCKFLKQSGTVTGCKFCHDDPVTNITRIYCTVLLCTQTLLHNSRWARPWPHPL